MPESPHFLKILSGQLEPTNGEVAITPGQRLSFLQQDHFKYDEYTVLDTVIMGNKRLYDIMKEKDAIYMKEEFTDEDGIKAAELEGEFATMNGWEAESDAENLLNGLGIETDLHYKTMKDLLGPQKVKVLLAQALFGNPDILLLDEPTNHLDITYQLELLEVIKGLGVGVIAALHDLNLASLFCDEIFIMKKGQVVKHGTPSKLINEDLIRDVYAVKSVVSAHDDGTPIVTYRRQGLSGNSGESP